LGFQALLALVPILLVLARVAGPLLGRETARQSLAEAAVRFAGPGADRIVSALIGLVAAAQGQTTRTVLGVLLLLFFASSFFARSQMALDAVWGVDHKKLGRKLVDREAVRAAEETPLDVERPRRETKSGQARQLREVLTAGLYGQVRADEAGRRAEHSGDSERGLPHSDLGVFETELTVLAPHPAGEVGRPEPWRARTPTGRWPA